MKRLENLLLALFVGIGLLAIGCGGSGKETTSQDQPAESTPAEASKPATKQAAATEPSEAGADDQGAGESKRPARRRRASRPPPVRGVARVQILTETRVEGNEVISMIRARNVSKGSITRFTASEYWYDDQGNATPGGSRTHRKPFLPGEVIELELRTRKNEKFYQNQFEFSHANGDVRATVVRSLPKPGEE
jgi:hypothetical protein